MKKLKFSSNLIELILNKTKDTTWRINDDKGLKIGDILSLSDGEKEFSKAEILWVKETSFEHLTNEDKNGHENFSSDEEMYKIYSGYYKINIGAKTRLKVIKFKLI
ncbi:ASCH domain-containing protein [Candidatus Gracilibacteria bacterium]|nr:ASCH domain-containing protein [Candidatus Gracilibacteria bacterium]NUJ99256.1 ASCH domain-containing protein [Candidatus Gracilibacteria bacterium]